MLSKMMWDFQGFLTPWGFPKTKAGAMVLGGNYLMSSTILTFLFLVFLNLWCRNIAFRGSISGQYTSYLNIPQSEGTGLSEIGTVYSPREAKFYNHGADDKTRAANGRNSISEIVPSCVARGKTKHGMCESSYLGEGHQSGGERFTQALWLQHLLKLHESLYNSAHGYVQEWGRGWMLLC